MYSRIGASAYKADLTNTRALCESLDNPHNKFKTIHVAGTNGKGSVSHMLAAILQTAGYKTGLYTSPHLKDFRERIKVNGEMIDEHSVIDFTQRITPQIEKISPSFFEITVAMAFEYFANQQVDLAIIETGLGGRLDSTNIIEPELSIITNIGWDHMNILGNTIEKIAFEKAGIIKRGRPVVIGEMSAETGKVFEKIAAENKAPLFLASRKRQVMDWNWKDYHLVVEIGEDSSPDHKIYELDLPGLYQAKNLLTVLETCSHLKEMGWKMEDADIKKALKNVRKTTGLHGRWEIILINPMVVLDVAHNEDGIRQLVQQAELTEHKALHIVLGMVKDKNIDAILKLLPRHAHYYFTKAQIPRAMAEDELAVLASIAGLKGESWSEVNAAINCAITRAQPEDLIIVCGSVFLVGEVEKSLLQHRVS